MTTLDEKIAHEISAIGVTHHAPRPSFHAQMSPQEMAAIIDHTVLKADTTEAQVRQLCAEAMEWGFASVCVNATWIPLCVELLADSPVKVCAVVGFALGATLPAVKAFEAQQVLALGAQEVDMVINVGKLKDQEYRLVHEDIAGVADECHEAGALLKVIIETGLLTYEEKIAACVIVKDAGADFVKTSTGFNGGGATTEDIALMRLIVGSELGVKASGGIRTAKDALAMVAAGATRIGASAGVQIVKEMASPDGGAQQASAVEPEESY